MTVYRLIVYSPHVADLGLMWTPPDATPWVGPYAPVDGLVASGWLTRMMTLYMNDGPVSCRFAITPPLLPRVAPRSEFRAGDLFATAAAGRPILMSLSSDHSLFRRTNLDRDALSQPHTDVLWRRARCG